jgi:predicted HTH domain antitoxin
MESLFFYNLQNISIIIILIMLFAKEKVVFIKIASYLYTRIDQFHHSLTHR